MNGIAWLFLYTPLPWLVVMYAAAYRHDPARIARPLQDRATLTDWWEVCSHLGLVDGNIKKPAGGFGFRSWLALFAAVFIGSVWAVVPAPLAWYELCALEAAAALPLFLALASAVGPLPYKPYGDFLPFPRLGTRVRHLAKQKATSRGTPSPPKVATSVGKGGATR